LVGLDQTETNAAYDTISVSFVTRGGAGRLLPSGSVLPEPPASSFASDNAAGVHPTILEALARANHGHALAYGNEAWTARAIGAFRELFGAPVEVLFTWGGTGANVVGLQCLLAPYQAVICPSGAHIAVDECGAPERFTGCKLVDVQTPDGKLRPEQIVEQLHGLGDEHHVQPKVVSITQSTELGTLHTADEIAAIAATAHAHGLLLHLDGARIANATAALGGDVRAFTIEAGVDVLTFGGTKAGAMYGEAVVFLDPALAAPAKFVRKQAGQLPSKMRYVAAQFEALLADGLWIALGAHANEMADRLYRQTNEVPGVTHERPPAVNSLFPMLPAAAAQTLREWCFFWPWDPAREQVRWMTAWDTTADDVDRFAAGVRTVMGAPGA
jgi:threonine aldolase